jgi:hypothetical protein
LSISTFEKVSVFQALTDTENQIVHPCPDNQLNLFDL